MKVIITNAPAAFWYADKLGEEFEVEDWKVFGDYRVKDEQLNIGVEDCEIVQ